MQKQVNQEESQQNKVDRTKKGAEGEVCLRVVDDSIMKNIGYRWLNKG